MQVWNYNESTSGLMTRGVNSVEIFVSDDNFATDNRSLGLFNFAIAPGTADTDFSQLVGLDTTARYVKLDIASNHGATGGYFGLSEVKFFEAVTVIPEPSTAILAGLGLAGLTLRRRRRNA